MSNFRAFQFMKWAEEFDKNLNGSSQRSAFEKTESLFEKRTGSRYYSGFESFKSARSNRNKRRK